MTDKNWWGLFDITDNFVVKCDPKLQRFKVIASNNFCISFHIQKFEATWNLKFERSEAFFVSLCKGVVINYWGEGGEGRRKFWGRAVFFLDTHLGWAIILWAHV